MPEFVHHLIEVARLRLGVSQSELARRLGRSQSFVSKLEAGLLLPDGETRTRLADALSVAVDFFDTEQQVYPKTLSFHRCRKTSKSEIDRLWAEMNMLRFALEPLLRSVDRRVDLELPQYDVEDCGAAMAAKFTRAALRAGPGPIRNLVALAERAGVFVMCFDFRSTAVDGVSHLNGDGLPHIVFLNKRVPGDRMRFSLAHELGHLVLHRCPSLTMEEEANQFAAELLMPVDDIGPILRRKLDLATVGALKTIWGCSMQSIYRRARDVGALTDSQYRRAMQVMAPYRITEPYPIVQENADAFAELWHFHLRQLGYTASELRKIVRVPDDLVRLALGQPGLAAVKSIGAKSLRSG